VNLLVPLIPIKVEKSPIPANPTQHQRPVRYCDIIECPGFISTAVTIALVRAKPTPDPIWNAVLIFPLLEKSLIVGVVYETYHSPTERFDIVWNRCQKNQCTTAINNRDTGHDHYTCREYMLPTVMR